MDYLHVVIHREKKEKLKKKLNGPALDGLLVKQFTFIVGASDFDHHQLNWHVFQDFAIAQ